MVIHNTQQRERTHTRALLNKTNIMDVVECKRRKAERVTMAIVCLGIASVLCIYEMCENNSKRTEGKKTWKSMMTWCFFWLRSSVLWMHSLRHCRLYLIQWTTTHGSVYNLLWVATWKHPCAVFCIWIHHNHTCRTALYCTSSPANWANAFDLENARPDTT